MSDLVEFLLQRIAEDEQRARDELHTHRCIYVEADWMCDCNLSARVLADCEAKRRIVELAWHDFGEEADPYDDGIRTGREMFRDAALRILATVYADHPDYDESWRP